MSPTLFARSMVVREIASRRCLPDLRALVAAHYRGEGQRSDLKDERHGTQRAVYALPSFRAEDTHALICMALKLAIPDSLGEVLYERTPETVAHEAGAFEYFGALEDSKYAIPKFFVGVRYTLAGGIRFGILTEDLTGGGFCNLKPLPPLDPMVNHAIIQIPPRSPPLTVLCDLKVFEQSNPEHARRGQPFTQPGALLDLDVITP